jgi:UDP-glucose 4-epimerase
MSLAEGPVLVTGGTGFIGRRLVQRLSSEGLAVRVFSLEPVRAGGERVVSIVGDVRDGGAIRRAVEGAHTVFHLAGRAHVTNERGDTGEHAAITVEGTRHAVTAAIEAGARRFVFVSSLAVYGSSLGSEPADEDTLVHPTTVYGRAKLEAEEIVREARSRGAIDGVCLRPAMTYGPACPGNLPRLIGLVDRGLSFAVPAAANRRSLLHVESLVDALLLAATKPVPGEGVYVVADAATYSTVEIVDLIARALHRSPPERRIPLALVRLLARCGDLLTQAVGRRVLFDSIEFEKLVGSAVVSPARICRELGFNPTRTLESSLAEVIAAWRVAA